MLIYKSGRIWQVRLETEPVAWSAPHIASNNYKPRPHIAWQREIRYLINGDCPDELWEGPVIIRKLHIWRTRPKSNKTPLPIQRPDIGNYEKAIEDALSKFVYKDDSQIVGKDNIRLRWADLDTPAGFEIQLLKGAE